MNKKYLTPGFANDFNFGKIMENPDRCKRFLEQILGINIHHIVYLESEKTFKAKYTSHGIRLDIYVDDGKTIFNCEMQSKNTGSIPKRGRYYQSMIDIHTLGKSVDYSLLKKSFVIFVCTFDLFGEDQYIYTFENTCKEVPTLCLGDDAIKIVINTKGHKGNVSEEFKELMSFIDTSEDRYYSSDLANDLLEDLKVLLENEKWRESAMTYEIRMQDEYNCGKAEGYEQGLEQGFENGLKQGQLQVLNSIKNGMNAFSLSFDEICDKLNITDREVYRPNI